MKVLDADSSLGKGPNEFEKRKREWGVVVALGLVFLILTWVAFRIFGYSKTLPIEHSIFFFGLVNFNLILFLLVLFLIFRNIVKSFSERPGKVIGSTLKSKLIAAFVAFSFVPTSIMFLVSVFYINSSFDKWFSEKTVSVLKSSMEVMNQYYVSAKKRNYHFAEEMAQQISKSKERNIAVQLRNYTDLYKLDAVEYYPSLLGQRVITTSDESSISEIPTVSLEFLKKGLVNKAEASYIHHFGEGNLVRIIRPLNYKGASGALVVSTFIPLSLTSKLDNITATYEDLKDSDSLSYPLKSIYLILLVLMTLVILLAATWFGFYLARQLSIPMEMLGKAANRVARGDYYHVKVQSGSPEINDLVNNFNLMSSDLETSRNEIQQSNKNLRKTLSRLDEYNRYIEVVLANVTTGVISANKDGVITMVNQHAAKLLRIEANKYVGQNIKEVMAEKYFKLLNELLITMRNHSSTSIQKEIRVDVKGRSIPLQMSLSIMLDENNDELGKILVFDDLTMVVSAQRAAAWNEVARRIAHEIKNPLTPISLAAQRLQRKFGEEIPDPAFADCTHMIIDQVDNLKTLVNEFSNFARMPKSKPVLSSIKKTIEESVVLFRDAHKDLKINLHVDESLPSFLFDPGQIKRAFTNLFDNALSATKGQSQALIEIDVQYNKPLKIVRIAVSDNGEGIAPKLRERIFEPYVTSKSHGTGLGLAIVKRTVEDHNGFIRAFANSPKGTKIIIELPVNVADTSNVLTSLHNPEV